MSVFIELAGIDEISVVEQTRIACAIIGAVDELHLSALDRVGVLEEDRFEGWGGCLANRVQLAGARR